MVSGNKTEGMISEAEIWRTVRSSQGGQRERDLISGEAAAYKHWMERPSWVWGLLHIISATEGWGRSIGFRNSFGFIHYLRPVWVLWDPQKIKNKIKQTKKKETKGTKCKELKSISFGLIVGFENIQGEVNLTEVRLWNASKPVLGFSLTASKRAWLKIQIYFLILKKSKIQGCGEAL